MKHCRMDHGLNLVRWRTAVDPHNTPDRQRISNCCMHSLDPRFNCRDDGGDKVHADVLSMISVVPAELNPVSDGQQMKMMLD